MRGVILLSFLLLAESAALTQAQTVSVWLTTGTQTQKLQPQTPVAFAAGNVGDNPLIVDETRTYQQVEGFGASFTDSAAYLLNQVATPAARSNAMHNLFTREGEGIGISFVRNPMGASDLSRFHYSYNDLPPGQTDTNLTSFSIAHDQVDIIPLVQVALQLNPQLKIMASPWSPPGWMKDSGSMIGGSLLPAMYKPFAAYFVRYIQAYQAEGIPIHYISLQNEPLYVPGDYPGMYMDAATQQTVLRDHILPALATNALSTQVLVYDHNYDMPGYPDTVLSDPTLLASSQVAGTAWHGYGGTPGMMLALGNTYPTKGNFQTEHSGGTWVGDQVRSDFADIIHVMRSGGKAYVKWGLALDQNRGPNTGGCNTCTPLVTVHTSSGTVSYSIDFYTLGHFSKFVLPGAQRIYSGNAAGVISAAFLNPDGSKALVAFNETTSSRTFQVVWGSQSFPYTLPSFSGATFTWSGPQSGEASVNPMSPVQASSFHSVSGLVTERTSDTLGGYNLGYADHGDYAVYENVNFAGAITQVSARVASFGGGTLEFRLGSPTGARIAWVAMPNTGDWQTWSNVSATASSVSGLTNLYLVFKGGPSIGNLNAFQFGGTPPPAATPTGLTATTGASQLLLNWNASPHATAYILKRAAVSGGPYLPIASPATPGYTDTNVVHCMTYYYVVSATNAAGESAPSSEAAAALGAYALAVNSGGGAAGTFLGDTNVSGGLSSSTETAISTTGVTQPAPQAVYQTERYGDSIYTFAGLTPGLSYTVRLHFAEYYWSSTGQRRFHVMLNGTPVLTNFDIFAAAGGQNKATVREFTTAANGSGQIVIQFTTVTDNAKSSGIEILQTLPAAPAGVSATAGDAEVTLGWSAAPGATGYHVKRATQSGGPYTSVTHGVTTPAYTDTGLANGTTYHYVVSTLQNVCESTNATEVSATPLTAFEQWQVQYYGSTTNPAAAPEVDAYGTGNNYFKYVAGLNPTNPASKFTLDIHPVPHQTNRVDLQFEPAVAGRTYTPRYSADPVGGVWTQLTNYAGPFTNAGQVTITDVDATPSNKFFRIDISLP